MLDSILNDNNLKKELSLIDELRMDGKVNLFITSQAWKVESCLRGQTTVL